MLYLNGYEVFDGRFPDNTFHINTGDCKFLECYSTKDPETGYDSHYKIVTSEDEYEIIWKYEKPEELFMLECLTMHLRDKVGAKSIHLIMPYVPNARMDRVKDMVGEVNILKYFCQIINGLGFSTVTICDPHSDAVVNQLDRCVVYTPRDLVYEIVNGEVGGTFYNYLFFPDEGAAKRYGPIYNFRPHIVGKKIRDWTTGAILKYEIADMPDNVKTEGAKVLIVDDICSKGGTFVHAVNTLKKAGFEYVSLMVTHLENTVFSGKLLSSPIKTIYCTDSLKHKEHDKIVTVSIELY